MLYGMSISQMRALPIPISIRNIKFPGSEMQTSMHHNVAYKRMDNQWIYRRYTLSNLRYKNTQFPVVPTFLRRSIT